MNLRDDYSPSRLIANGSEHCENDELLNINRSTLAEIGSLSRTD